VREPTLLAFATRPRLFSAAEQQLPQPDGEPLLPNAARTVQQQACRQGAAVRSGAQLLAQPLVAMQFDKRH
jgi:hypothetical protein